jgi:hypothetical protein
MHFGAIRLQRQLRIAPKSTKVRSGGAGGLARGFSASYLAEFEPVTAWFCSVWTREYSSRPGVSSYLSFRGSLTVTRQNASYKPPDVQSIASTPNPRAAIARASHLPPAQHNSQRQRLSAIHQTIPCGMRASECPPHPTDSRHQRSSRARRPDTPGRSAAGPTPCLSRDARWWTMGMLPACGRADMLCSRHGLCEYVMWSSPRTEGGRRRAPTRAQPFGSRSSGSSRLPSAAYTAAAHALTRPRPTPPPPSQAK